jgi:hypothetical protein
MMEPEKSKTEFGSKLGVSLDNGYNNFYYFISAISCDFFK